MTKFRHTGLLHDAFVSTVVGDFFFFTDNHLLHMYVKLTK